MKKFEYLEKHIDTSTERHDELSEAKPDEREIPYYSKEVPISSEKKYAANMVVITYNWKNLYETTLKVKEITYEDGNNLEGLYKLPVRDGVDKAAFNFNGKAYVIRQVLRTIAKEIYENAKNVAGVVEKIIGHLRTVAGNCYIITKLEKEAWVFDGGLKTEGIRILDLAALREEHKKVLLEQILERTADLHLEDYILGNFSMNSIMLYDNAVLFSDLRMLKKTRKLSFLVGEFQKILSVLKCSGIVGSEEDLAYAVRYYVTENPLACREWFREEAKKEPKDDEEIAELLEERLYC